MLLIGVDYHPSFQTIAFFVEETGECGEQELNHSDGQAEKFYRDLKILFLPRRDEKRKINLGGIMRPHVLLLLLLLAFATLGIFVCMVSAQGEIKSQVNPKDGLTYVWIPPGTFQMGCSPGDNDCGGDEKPSRAVSITKGFWMGQTLVTQTAYQRVENKNPSHFHGDRLPVERITWFEAEAYCEAVQMHLPSEEEWEYAARAGTTTPRYGNLDDIAWYAGNSGNQTHEVGTKQPNAWMLYDMLGNVWEWSADWQIPGQYRMLRGGSRHGPKDTRVSYRNSSYPPNGRHNFIGFRCVGETVP